MNVNQPDLFEPEAKLKGYRNKLNGHWISDREFQRILDCANFLFTNYPAQFSSFSPKGAYSYDELILARVRK